MHSQLLSELKLSATFINNIIDYPERFYLKREQPKMKFGREQKDDYGLPKMRTTFAPIAFLKFKQREVNKYLQSVQLPKCMFGAIVNKSSIKNTLQHFYGGYFFTVDLKNFFSNISNKQVHHALLDHGYSWNDARIITKLCTINGSLPQGAPTSSTLANIVFASTAQLLEDFCAKKGIIFTVFVDDLTFSSKYDFSYCTNDILKIITKNGFYLNRAKIHYTHKSCEVTGLFIKNKKILLEKEMLKHLDNPRIKAYLENVEKHLATHLRENSILN